MSADVLERLAVLREPFPANQINQLPKLTCTDCSNKQCSKHQKAKCNVCGAWISTAHIHLDYVGHAALTDRLLDVDPAWFWEPMAFDADGLPKFDPIGGLWIWLTILGVRKIGYGDAQGKKGNNAIKEAIGDALRNAGMRFGIALALWHKGDLHDEDAEPVAPPAPMAYEPVGQHLGNLKALIAQAAVRTGLFTLTSEGDRLANPKAELAADYSGRYEGKVLADADEAALSGYLADLTVAAKVGTSQQERPKSVGGMKKASIKKAIDDLNEALLPEHFEAVQQFASTSQILGERIQWDGAEDTIAGAIVTASTKAAAARQAAAA